MIEQYLLNTNESAILSILQNFLQLNKAIGSLGRISLAIKERDQITSDS
jgi:hypothetical protein